MSLAPSSRLNPQSNIIITPLHAPHLPAVSPTLSYSMGKPATLVIANTSGSLPASVRPNSEARKQTATLGGLTCEFQDHKPMGGSSSESHAAVRLHFLTRSVLNKELLLIYSPLSSNCHLHPSYLPPRKKPRRSEGNFPEIPPHLHNTSAPLWYLTFHFSSSAFFPLSSLRSPLRAFELLRIPKGFYLSVPIVSCTYHIYCVRN